MTIVRSVENGQEDEYLIENLIDWFDFKKNKPPSPVWLTGLMWKLSRPTGTWESTWTTSCSGPPTQRMCIKKGLSGLYFPSRFRSFNIYNQMLLMFYEFVLQAPSSLLWCAGARESTCWAAKLASCQSLLVKTSLQNAPFIQHISWLRKNIHLCGNH